MLQYVADELIFQGVERNRGEEYEKTCNSEVAGMHLDWDFGTKAWTATFVAGVHVGTTKRFAAEQLTKEHWKKMIELSMIDSRAHDRKTVSERIVTSWRKAIVDQNVGEFEKEWGLVCEAATKKTLRGKP